MRASSPTTWKSSTSATALAACQRRERAGVTRGWCSAPQQPFSTRQGSTCGTLFFSSAQAHLGFVGASIILMWWMLSFMARELLGRNSNWYLSGWTGVILPQSLVLVSSSSGGGSHFSHILLVSSVWLPLLANAFLLLGLATWFTYRYGRGPSESVNERRWRLSWRLPPIVCACPFAGRVPPRPWFG